MTRQEIKQLKPGDKIWICVGKQTMLADVISSSGYAVIGYYRWCSFFKGPHVLCDWEIISKHEPPPKRWWQFWR